MATRLTKPLLNAIEAALNSALAGEFDGGDFDGMDPKHFERARDWVDEQLTKRGNANTADVSMQATLRDFTIEQMEEEIEWRRSHAPVEKE